MAPWPLGVSTPNWGPVQPLSDETLGQSETFWVASDKLGKSKMLHIDSNYRKMEK